MHQVCHINTPGPGCIPVTCPRRPSATSLETVSVGTDRLRRRGQVIRVPTPSPKRSAISSHRARSACSREPRPPNAYLGHPPPATYGIRVRSGSRPPGAAHASACLMIRHRAHPTIDPTDTLGDRLGRPARQCFDVAGERRLVEGLPDRLRQRLFAPHRECRRPSARQ